MLHFLPNRCRDFYILQMALLVTFLIAGLIVFPIVLLTYIFLFKTHKLLYKATINYLCYFLWIHFTYIAQWWSGLRLRFYADDGTKKMLGKENALIIMNHKYDIDWIATWIISEKYGGLGGAKSFVKKSLKYFPVVGWIWNFNGTVFLNRNWQKDKEIIRSSLEGFSDLWPGFINLLLLCPEGTRFTTKKMEVSNSVARSKGIPELKHSLIPRTKGFVESVKILRTQIDAIYNITIGFPESIDPVLIKENLNKPSLTLKNILNGKVKEGDVSCERILMKDLPHSDEDLSLWLQELFRKKDDLFDYYVHNGNFGYPHILIEPSLNGLIVYCISFTIIWVIMVVGFLYILLVTDWTTCSIFLGIMLSTFIFIQMSMKETQTEKGSSYGDK